MTYTVSDEFGAYACKHCAPLFIIRHHVEMAPTADDLSATLTFIKFQGRTYGITCRHVVTSLRNRIKRSGSEFSHTFLIALTKHHVVQDRFVVPPGDWVTPEPDIAIRELHPDFPAYVGKVALDIEANPVPQLSKVSFAVAVGFPDRLKTQIPTPLGYQLAMPCVHAVAENHSKAGSTFSLFSELEATPNIRDLSGMSGGPIYWSNGTAYGLLGITYESSPQEGSISGSASVHIKGHVADRETIEKWASHVSHLYAH
ncbi:MAG: hypothetical protein IPP12_17975 [Nitrospira sp.]|jgi:hypothetical protein|nr:hypothetical protein [Nitrospira sp.]MBK9949054.1 hypothetical protein [Nitrospira sp.]MBL8053608.1 hypothetical protein [Nitrospira sp.]